MVCLKASVEQIDALIEESKEDFAAFYDEDLPSFKYTAVAFRPVGRETGGRLFSDLSLA